MVVAAAAEAVCSVGVLVVLFAVDCAFRATCVQRAAMPSALSTDDLIMTI